VWPKVYEGCEINHLISMWWHHWWHHCVAAPWIPQHLVNIGFWTHFHVFLFSFFEFMNTTMNKAAPTSDLFHVFLSFYPHENVSKNQENVLGVWVFISAGFICSNPTFPTSDLFPHRYDLRWSFVETFVLEVNLDRISFFKKCFHVEKNSFRHICCENSRQNQTIDG